MAAVRQLGHIGLLLFTESILLLSNILDAFLLLQCVVGPQLTTMANNHLEQLLAEWYEYRGFFVRRNVNVGKRPNGGYACELDVVAFHPGERRLVHLEPSLDTDSWERREMRYSNKFEMGRKYIPEIFAGLDLPPTIEQYAVLVFASGTNVKTLGGAPIVLAGQLIEEILTGLREKRLAKAAVSEQFPLLRTLQYVAEYRIDAIRALTFDA